MDSQLVLQLSDPPPRGHQLRVIAAGYARDLAAVDQLPPPGIDRLGADLQVIRDLCDGSPRSHQVQDLAAELSRVTPRHNVLHGLLDG